jgi:hypothetical protein
MKTWLAKHKWIASVLWAVTLCLVTCLGAWLITANMERDTELIALAVLGTFSSWLSTVSFLAWLASVTLRVPSAQATAAALAPEVIKGPDPRP